MYLYFGKDSPSCFKKEIWGLFVAVFILTCLTGCQSNERRIEREFAAKFSKMDKETKEYNDTMKLLVMATNDWTSALKKCMDADKKGENKKNYEQQFDLARAFLGKTQDDVTVKRGKALTQLYEIKRYGEQNEIILRKTMKDYDTVMYGISKYILMVEEDEKEVRFDIMP